MSFKFLPATGALLVTTLMLSFSALGASDKVKVTLSQSSKPDLVKVYPSSIDGHAVDVIKVGNLPEISIRAALPDDQYTEAEKLQLSEIRRDILDKTITGIISGPSALPTLITDESVIKAESGDVKAQAGEENFFEDFKSAALGEQQTEPSREEIKRKRSIKEKCVKFVGFLNENILVSTYQAGKTFMRDTKGSRGKEFGLSLVFRGELQIGVGKTNLMRTISRGLDIGYDIKNKELVIRTVVRHEKMDGGTAMALGPKIEIRAYRANLEEQEHQSSKGHVHGKSWYPPAPPLVTFASESYPGYHSIGTAFALNVFDAVVPTYLFNTVNEFDADYRVRRISLSPTKYVRLTVSAVRSWFKERSLRGNESSSLESILSKVRPSSARPMANSCRSIFTPVN